VSEATQKFDLKQLIPMRFFPFVTTVWIAQANKTQLNRRKWTLQQND